MLVTTAGRAAGDLAVPRSAGVCSIGFGAPISLLTRWLVMPKMYMEALAASAVIAFSITPPTQARVHLLASGHR